MSKPFSEMTPQEKRERLNYLRFRVRVAALAISFIHVLSRWFETNENEKLMKKRIKVLIDDEEKIKKGA